MRVRPTAALLLTVLLAGLSLGAGAQEPSTPPRTNPRPARITADGSKNPERISDDVVARAVITRLIAAFPTRKTDTQKARQYDLFSELTGLRGRDLDVLRTEIGRLRPAFDAQRQRLAEAAPKRAAGDSTDVAAVRSAGEQLDTQILETRERLLELLTKDGAAQFRRYLEDEKRKIVLGGPPK